MFFGFLVWLAGFIIEVVADNQKKKFKEDLNNKDKFISHGLWAWSRHPNYFGEILLWIGITIIAIPIFKNWDYLALISPIFIYYLLVNVSGIPMLEKAADQKWGIMRIIFLIKIKLIFYFSRNLIKTYSVTRSFLRYLPAK